MISLADARRHLRIDGTQDDEEIAQKLLMAEAIIETYATNTETASTSRETALDAARLLVLGDLWQSRESGTSNALSPAVINILQLFREPGYA